MTTIVTVIISGEESAAKGLAKNIVNSLDGQIDFVESNFRGQIDSVRSAFRSTTTTTEASIEMKRDLGGSFVKV